MKKLKFFAAIALFAVSLTVPFVVRADDTNSPSTSTNAVVKPYPLDTCVYDGMKLGSMGDPYVFVYQGQEIKLCCAGCKSRFLADPDTYMKKIKDAEDAQKNSRNRHYSC